MLQQTQVATVIPYFQRFVQRFPTVHELAAASQEEVLQLWEGLGYYRRARQLHAAAKTIVAEHAGHFPQDFQSVLALPGIGRYTAGAILSIATGQRCPIVEANTQRLFSRLLAVTAPLSEARTVRLLWHFAESILPQASRQENRVGSFNQAAMELGALVCTPKAPKCLLCPLRQECAAYAQGLEDQIPGKVKQVQYQDRTEFALLVHSMQRGHADAPLRYFVYRIPEQQRWGGLWDFPRFGPPEAHSLRDATQAIRRRFGLQVSPQEPLPPMRHGVTRYRITLHAWHAVAARQVGAGERQRWVTAQELTKLPLSVTGRKLAEMLN